MHGEREVPVLNETSNYSYITCMLSITHWYAKRKTNIYDYIQIIYIVEIVECEPGAILVVSW